MSGVPGQHSRFEETRKEANDEGAFHEVHCEINCQSQELFVAAYTVPKVNLGSRYSEERETKPTQGKPSNCSIADANNDFLHRRENLYTGPFCT